MRVMKSRTLFESFQDNLNMYDKLTEADENLKLIFDSEDEAYIEDTPEAELRFDDDWDGIKSLVNNQINDYLILIGSAKEWNRGGAGYKVKKSLEDMIGNNDGVRVYTDNSNNLFLYCYDHDGNTEGQLFTFVDDYSDKAEKLLQDYYGDEDFSMYYFTDWLDGGTMDVLQKNGLLKPIKDSGLNEDVKPLEPENSSVKSFYDKAKIDSDGKVHRLISYKTPIMEVKDGEITMLCKPEHLTQTTLRHVREFLQQMGLEPLTKKELIKLIPSEEVKECDKIEEQDSLVRIVTPQQEERDYTITDITELNQVSDGDVLPPLDIAELLVDVDSKLTESVGANWGQINFQSTRFNKDTNDSNALFELCVGDKTYLMSMLLEENGTLLKVNNTKGKTIFKRKSNDIVGLAESYIKQFIPGKESEEVPECLKHMNETLHERLNFIKSYIEMLKLAPKEEKETFKGYITKEIYAFVAELSDVIKAEEPTDEDKLELPTFDKMVEEVFGKDWVKEEPKENKLELDGVETLKESYEVWQKYYDEDGTVATPEFVQSFSSYEDAEKFAEGLNKDSNCEAYVTEKESSLKEEELKNSIFTSFRDSGNDEGIIGSLFFRINGRLDSFSLYKEDDEYKLLYGIIVPDEIKEFVEQNGGYDKLLQDAIDFAKAEKNHNLKEDEEIEAEVDNENPAEVVDEKPQDEQKNGLGTGFASFVRKPENISQLNDKAKYFTDGDASYLICARQELSKDEFDKIQESFLSSNQYCKEFEPLDTENYAYNVIEFTCPDYDYKLLVDPSGFDYCRYVAKIGGNE